MARGDIVILGKLNDTLAGAINFIKTINWTKRKRLAVTGLVIAVIFVFFLLNGKNGAEAEAMTVEPQKYEEKIIAVGQLQLAKETTLVSEVDGEIQTIGADEGSVISAGSVIISIRNTDLDFELEQKKAGYENADAQYQHLQEYDYAAAKGDLAGLTTKKDQAKKAYDAAGALYQQGAISQIDYLNYKADYETSLASWNAAKLKVASLGEGGALRSSSAAQLESARVSYESALNDQKKYQIAVPWNSVLLKTYVGEHDYVRPGDRLADIGEAGSSHVFTELDEKYFPYLSKGMKAVISVGDPGTADGTEGYVDVISPKINADTGTFEVKIGLPDKFPYLASDLTVNVEILIKEQENAIVISDRYLADKDGSVYLYRNGKAVKTSIRYEKGPSSNLLVTEGLKAGDTIIRPDSSVKDGKAVKINKRGGAS
jgi:multidrug efflux pump subunit AcrA (membrane-fusion protein)